MEFEWSDLELGGEGNEDKGSEVTGGSNLESVGEEDGEVVEGGISDYTGGGGGEGDGHRADGGEEG